MTHVATRRGVLQRLGLVAGGVGLATTGLVESADAAPTSRTAATHLRLFASELRTKGARAAPVPGSQTLITGVLAPRAGGPAHGELVITSTLIAPASLLEPGAGALQTQTFVIPGGTIVGSGLLHHNGTGTFAVVGGTGSYHGVSGSYAVRQEVDAFAGGTAEYVFSLVEGEVSGR